MQTNEIVLIKATLAAGMTSAPDDLTSDGRDAVEGTYAISVASGERPNFPVFEGADPIIEVALDRFHDKIGISELDNYDIETTRLSDLTQLPPDADWL